MANTTGKANLPPILRAPVEIRLLIYQHLLVARTNTTPNKYDYHEYEKSSRVRQNLDYFLSFRNAPCFKSKNGEILHRSTHMVRHRMYGACTPVMYKCINNPGIDASILSANRQIYHEASEILYGTYTFDFDTHIEACVPFMTDRTPSSRDWIRGVSIVKRALPYDKVFDQCEWADMCLVLSSMLALTQLSLGVVAGKPMAGWGGIKALQKHHFQNLIPRMDRLEWIEDLAKIKGLKQLDIRACVEHCQPPVSEGLHFFVAFSASIEAGFSEYLTERLIEQRA